jgi:ABC-type antimicrobial peptide transport system permease subunit
VIIGLVEGMAGAFIAPFDPLVYASAITLLSLASLVACWMPARTAARTDPDDKHEV